MKPTSPASELIEAVRLLHSIFVPAAEIARRMHVDQATVLHIIMHGTVPYRQRTLWSHHPASPYESTP